MRRLPRPSPLARPFPPPGRPPSACRCARCGVRPVPGDWALTAECDLCVAATAEQYGTPS